MSFRDSSSGIRNKIIVKSTRIHFACNKLLAGCKNKCSLTVNDLTHFIANWMNEPICSVKLSFCMRVSLKSDENVHKY